MAAIYSKGGRLYLRATLPRRDGNPGRKQEKIKLSLPDTVQGRIKAKRELARLERQLENKSFHWDDWIDPEHQKGSKSISWREAIDRYYEWRRYEKGTKDDHWQKKYLPLITKAPIKLANPCATEDMAAVLSSWDPSQDAYMKAHRAFKKLAELAGVPFPQQTLKPSYSLPQQRGEPKAVPTDEEVIEWVQLSNRGQPNGEALSWYFGMMAAYGLRPHEIDHAVMIDNDVIQVPFVGEDGRKTKTGFRTVVPVLQQWLSDCNLRNKKQRPVSKQSTYRWLSNSLRGNPYVKKGWTNLSLRHAYAGRLWRVGGAKLDVTTAARLMGHSAAVHEKTYRHHIDPYQIALRAQEAIAQNMEDWQERLQREILPQG